MLELMLLGIKLEDIDVKIRTSLWYSLTAARLQYVRFWKQEKLPTTENWIQAVLKITEMYKLSRKLRNQESEDFNQCWKDIKSTWRKDGIYMEF